PGGAELYAGGVRNAAIFGCERARFRHLDPAHRHAGAADRIPDRRYLRVAVVWPVRRRAVGVGWTRQRRPAEPDGAVHHGGGQFGGGARRGLGRVAARRGSHRTTDRAATGSVAGHIAAAGSAVAALRARAPRPVRTRQLLLSVAAAAASAARTLPLDRSRTDGRTRRRLRRGQEHDIPAAAALL